MSDERITQQDIDEILRLVQSAEHIEEFRIKYGDLELNVSRNGAVGLAQPASNAAPRAQPPPVTKAPAAPTKPSLPQEIPAGMAAVKAPMVGTFYRAPSPGATPFVEVGAAVTPDTVVGIIEVMKLMNSMPAGVAGIVRQILVEDSQPVGFGQALILIEPHA